METQQAVETKPEVQAFTVQLDLETYRRLKIAALNERRPMSKVVRDAIRSWCDLHGSTESA